MTSASRNNGTLNGSKRLAGQKPTQGKQTELSSCLKGGLFNEDRVLDVLSPQDAANFPQERLEPRCEAATG